MSGTVAGESNIPTTIARSAAEAKPQLTSGTASLSQPCTKTKRKRPAVSKASSDSEQHDSDDDLSAKKPRHHQSEHGIEKMAELFLASETRRRKSTRLSPLTDHEQGIILKESGNLIRRCKHGMTFENIKQSSRLLRIVAREVVAESDNDLYASALFAAQYRRVYAELNLIEASVGSGRDMTSQELEALEGPIKRLHRYLHQDTTWRHVLRHLGLMTESLALVRSKIRCSSNLHRHVPLATAADAIERLLMPTDCREEDLAASLDPLEVALKDNRDLQAKLTRMGGEYKAIIKTKEEKLIECNMRLKLRADLPNHGTAQSAIFRAKELEVELAEERKARHLAERELKDDIAALSAKHKDDITTLSAKFKDDMAKAADLCEVKLEEQWTAREKQLQQKFEKEPAKLRAVQTKQAELNNARRAELQAKLKRHNAGIQTLRNRKQDGTLALTTETEIPSKQSCLDGLTKIWRENSITLLRLLPHDLFNDPDFALEFEVETIVAAQVYILTMDLWGSTPQELLKTGWSPTALHRLMCGLLPYQLDTALSSLSLAITDVYQRLQEVANGLNKSARHGMILDPSQTVAGDSHSIKTSQATVNLDPDATLFVPEYDIASSNDHSSNSRGPNIVGTDATPPMPCIGSSQVWQSSYDDDVVAQGDLPGSDVVYPDLDGPMSTYADADSYVPVPAASTTYATTIDTNVPGSGTIGRPAKPCWEMMRNGSCRFGDECRFSHGPESARSSGVGNGLVMADHVDKRASIICRNIEQFEQCRTSDCPYKHPPGTHLPASVPIPFATVQDGQQQPRKKVPCRNEKDGGRCTRSNCHFQHQNYHGVEQDDAMLINHTSGSAFHGQHAPTSQGHINRNPTKQCFKEIDDGRCTKPNCTYYHQFSRGPLDDGSSVGDINSSHGASQRQRNLLFGGAAHLQRSIAPPTGPRAGQNNTLAGRMSFPPGDTRNKTALHQAGHANLNNGFQRHQQRGGRGGRGRGRGHDNRWDNNNDSSNMSQVSGGGSSNHERNLNRGRGGGRGHRGGGGGGGRGRGGFGGRTGRGSQNHAWG